MELGASDVDVKPFAVLEESRIVIIGFDDEASDRLITIFQTAGAFCQASRLNALAAAIQSCDLLVAKLEGMEDYAALLAPVTAPVIAAVSPDSAPDHLRWIRRSTLDYVFYPCTETEILTRAAMAAHRRKAQTARHPGEKVRILFADDDDSISALLKATFESAGMTCRCVRNGVEALTVAREWAPDVAVLDVNMPGMSGFQALSVLSRTEKPIPVLLLTACDQESEILKGFKLGAADYVIKPFNPTEILMRVKRIVATVGCA